MWEGVDSVDRREYKEEVTRTIVTSNGSDNIVIVILSMLFIPDKHSN